MTKRELRCSLCMKRCPLVVSFDGQGKVLSVDGGQCPRGARFAAAESGLPKWTATATVRCEDGGKLPVKTKEPIPKELMDDVMQKIGQICVKTPIEEGEVVLENVCNTGVDVVADATRK